jgi:hypothetical protein
MIRRDYFLRMIEQCVQALARSAGLVHERSFDQARGELDESMRALAGLDLRQVCDLPDAELLAVLLRGEPTQVLRQKCLLVVALLHRAGEVHAAREEAADARRCCLKALNLQLQVLAQQDALEMPEFVPRIDLLVGALEGEPLPVPTTAALMQHYERSGAYGRAEDALFGILDAQGPNANLAKFGTQFYERLLRQTDEALELGNLPRGEVEAGLAEWKAENSGTH